MTFAYILFLLICGYFLFNILYLLVFSIAGLFREKKSYPDVDKKNKIAVLIPAYKDDAVIVDTAIKAVNSIYPRDFFDVIIIADHLQDETIKRLSELPILLLNVSFPVSTKARSLSHAVLNLSAEYDIAVILDSDNVMDGSCLQIINSAFEHGVKLVQLHRTAKNRNTNVAVLDAISEELNNHIFRSGHRALGLSSALIGSGMAIDYNVFKELIIDPDIQNNPGEDRELYFKLLNQGYICEYIEDSFVYDEKVQSSQVLGRQRTRWISAQLQYAVFFWVKNPLKTLRSNIHYLDYAIQTLLLPRVLLFGAVFLIAIALLVVQFVFHLSIGGLSLVFVSCTFSSIIIIFSSIYNKIPLQEFCSSLLTLPRVFFTMMVALLRSKTGQSTFIHTPKEYIEEP